MSEEITIIITGPAESGKSAVASLIATMLKSKDICVVNNGDFEHPPERAENILKNQLQPSIKIVEIGLVTSVLEETS